MLLSSLHVGFLVAKPALISLLEQGEEPGALILQVTEERGFAASLCPGKCKAQQGLAFTQLFVALWVLGQWEGCTFSSSQQGQISY